MGMVQTEITLKNLYDEAYVQSGQIKPEDIRTVTVTAIADTGSMYLVITDEIRQKLGLNIIDERIAHIANGQKVTCQITDSVKIHWKDRKTVVPALVIPGATKILLGAIPMEAMDLMVNPVTQEVVGIHGEAMEILTLFYE